MEDHPKRAHVRTRDTGQLLPLVALVIACAGLGIIGLGRLTQEALATSRAATAADAAALAGAHGGPDAARVVAAENGARLVSFTRVSGDVRVVVRRGEATASARARLATTRRGGGRFAERDAG